MYRVLSGRLIRASELDVWVVVAPFGTPKATIGCSNSGLLKIMAKDEIRARFPKMTSVPGIGVSRVPDQGISPLRQDRRYATPLHEQSIVISS
jgi:hypothetical protein